MVISFAKEGRFHLQRTRLESDSQRGFSFYLEQSLSLFFFFFYKKEECLYIFQIFIYAERLGNNVFKH